MATARIPASANVMFRYGSNILLIKRSSRANAWPNFWALPGGKVDDQEFFRETAQREISEEIWLSFKEKDIIKETILMHRNIAGTKIIYFCRVDNWTGMPEILEKNLATDLAWFPIDSLPNPLIPHHKEAIFALENNIFYSEFNTAP